MRCSPVRVRRVAPDGGVGPEVSEGGCLNTLSNQNGNVREHQILIWRKPRVDPATVVTTSSARGRRPWSAPHDPCMAYRDFRKRLWLKDGSQIRALHAFIVGSPPTGDDEWEAAVDKCAARPCPAIVAIARGKRSGPTRFARCLGAASKSAGVRSESCSMRTWTLSSRTYRAARLEDC